MTPLVKKILSLDDTLYLDKKDMHKKTSLLISKANQKYEELFELKKEKLKSLKAEELKKLETYLQDKNEKKKTDFFHLKEKLSQNKNLDNYVEDIFTTIKHNLCERKEF